MPAYRVTVTRVTSYLVVASDAEDAVDLALGADEPMLGESVLEEGTETVAHTVEETQASRGSRRS